MATSKIEWTDKVWNPVVGCSAVSSGCQRCYAAKMTRRLEAMGKADYAGLANERHFNGTVRTLPDKLDTPLGWKKPRRIFVNSMSDLFHKDVPFDFIDKVFAVMAVCPQHTFQVLTKRPERMAEYLKHADEGGRVAYQIHSLNGAVIPSSGPMQMSGYRWPLPNVWLGTSIENQAVACRTNALRDTPAAVRFVSAEPLLGPTRLLLDGIGWVIVGGESGPYARPMDVDWLVSIVARCEAAGVPVFVKQDSGPWSGKQGRIPHDIWALKQFPEVAS